MLIIGAISTMQTKELEFRVANLDCEHDAAAIERGLQDFPGITDLKVYPKSAKVAIAYDPAATQPEIVSEKLVSLGFPAQKGLTMAEPPKPWRNPKVITSVLSGVLLLVGWLVGLAGAPEIVSTVVYIAAILIGGYYFGREAIEELIFEREIGIEMLMAVAAVVATVLGMPAEGAMLVFLYSISEAAEGYTEQKTRSAIKALMNLAPKVATYLSPSRASQLPLTGSSLRAYLVSTKLPSPARVCRWRSSRPTRYLPVVLMARAHWKYGPQKPLLTIPSPESSTWLKKHRRIKARASDLSSALGRAIVRSSYYSAFSLLSCHRCSSALTGLPGSPAPPSLSWLPHPAPWSSRSQ